MEEKIEKLAMGATAVLSVAISLLDLLGVLDAIPWLAGRTSALTLLVVGFLAGYLVLERRSKLDKIERLVTEGIERTIVSLKGVEVRSFTDPQEVYEYVHKRMWQAQKSIDDLTWGRSITGSRTPSQEEAHKKYFEAITKICSRKNIRYREVMTFPSIRRLERAETLIAQNLYGYHLRYYDIPHQQMPPLMLFMVIDSAEVIVAFYRSPYLPPEGELHFAVKHPDIVSLFQDYYDAIWHGAKVIKDADRVEHGVLREIRQKLEAS